MTFLAWCGAFALGFLITGVVVFAVALLHSKPGPASLHEDDIESKEWFV